MNYTNWMKSIECLEWCVKDVDLDSFNCRNVQEVEIYYSARNGECIQCVYGYIVTTHSTG